MRSQDGPDGAAAGPQPDSAQPVQLLTRPDENSHEKSNGADEPAAVGQSDPPQLPAELEVRLAALESTLVEVVQRLAGDNDRALARERVIDRQHAEIERLKSVERAGQLRPVVTDLCRLRNGLLRQAETVPAEMTGPQVATLLDSFAATVADTLERCGVVALPREVGGAFAPSRQQVATVVDIDDPERDGTVAEVVQDGYAEIDGGKVVVAARISLHRYAPKDKKETSDG
jgi:molecular chaperone GrpE